MGTVISQERWSAENRANTQREANRPVGDGEASEVAHSSSSGRIYPRCHWVSLGLLM